MTAARYYQAAGLGELSRVYLLRARRAYARWGAVGRVAAIDLAHPNLDRGGGSGLGEGPGASAPRVGAQTSSGTGVQLPLALDFASLFKATQAFAEEIELDRLLDKIMAIVVENAGAARGVLLLDRGQGLVGARSYAIAETRSVDLGAFANGASHVVQFEYVNPSGSGKSSFVIDDLGIDSLDFLDIAFAVGFNSKSVFNRVFTQLKSVTPSEFRRRQSDTSA